MLAVKTKTRQHLKLDKLIGYFTRMMNLCDFVYSVLLKYALLHPIRIASVSIVNFDTADMKCLTKPESAKMCTDKNNPF